MTADAALDAAARAVIARAHDFRPHAASADEVRETLEAALLALRAPLAGEVDPPRVERAVLGRRLLAALRAELVRTLLEAGGPPPDDLLPVMAAIERLRAALEPDYASRFADSLSGRHGPGLIVELAHDLRSPLTSILFLSEAMLRERSGAVTPVQRHQLGLIYSAALGLSAVASDVLELVRGLRPEDLQPVPFALREILDAVRDIVQPMAESKKLRVQLELLVDDRLRVGLPQAVHRVVLNLTTNALKFTNEGGVRVGVVPVDDRRVRFSVVDSGRGIPPEVLPTLFDTFRRRHGDGDYAFSGAGLGLTICRQLVEAMGAELEVDSQPGVGTEFSFTLDLPPVGEEELHELAWRRG